MSETEQQGLQMKVVRVESTLFNSAIVVDSKSELVALVEELVDRLSPDKSDRITIETRMMDIDDFDSLKNADDTVLKR